MHGSLITGSIVIYKNDPVILRKAVDSFLSSAPDSVLYMIDNSPRNVYQKQFSDPRIRFVFNNQNVGFGAGHNIALRKALEGGKASYHVVLNPDVYFQDEVVKTIFDYMEQNPSIGMVMPKVLYPDGRLQPLCKLLPSPVTLFSRRFLAFHRSFVTKMNHLYEMHFSGYDKIMDVPFLSGCFMFLRMDALKKIGLFDERIFLYTEDTDLSRRIHQHYRTVFFPDATIYHYNDRGSYRNALRLLHHMRSAITYFNKWGWFKDAERELINQRALLKLSQ
jgi:GT2 family glycosyltransferase